MHCSTIIVSYNTFDLTREAITTALAAADGLESEVIVVDNNSPDDSARRLREAFAPAAFPNVHVVANQDNAGFSKANNQGAAMAQGEILFFLNPDTIVHGQAIRILYDFLMAHPEAGAIGPHVVNEDGTDQRSTSSLFSVMDMVRHHLPVRALWQGLDQHQDYLLDQTQPAEILHGCAMALRRTVFDEVGGWDEAYFMYSEERELCSTLIQAGYTNYYVHEAQITHYGGASTWENYAEQQIVQHQSALQYLKRHHSPLILVLNRVTGTLGFGLRMLIFRMLAHRHPEAAPDYRRRGKAAARIFRWFLFEYS